MGAKRLFERTQPVTLRVKWRGGLVPAWMQSLLERLSVDDAVKLLPFSADKSEGDGPAAAQAQEVALWPGTVYDNLRETVPACEWAIVDPDGTPVLQAARLLRHAAEGRGWELLLLEREDSASSWQLRRWAHVASAPTRDAAHHALADAAVRLVRQGALDRALGNPLRAVHADLSDKLSEEGRARRPQGSYSLLSTVWRAWLARQRARFTAEHWCIGVIDAPIHRVLGSERLEVRWLTHPDSRGYFADPFGMPRDPNRLMAEYFDERTGKGHLERLTLESDGSIRFRERLDVGEGLHASFPAVFDLDGQQWGLAETAQAQKLTLYRVDEAGRWQREADLLTGIQAADPVLFKVGQRYWLAYTDVAMGAMDNLCLAHADALSGPWMAHANNPVRVDIRGARMAGRPFMHEGAWYRPAQDCLHRYGAGIVIHRIDHISPEYYEETTVRHLVADQNSHLPHGMHTLSAWGDRTLVDAKIERMNFVSWMRKLRDRVGRPASGGVVRPLNEDRVFVYIPHLRTGGGEMSMLRVAAGLAERGLDVEVVVHEATSRELPLPRGVTLIDLQATGTAQAVRRLAQRIRKRAPRYVISAFPHTNIATVTAAKMARCGTMTILTEHAPLAQQIAQQNNWRYRVLPALVRAAYRRADAVVAVSAGVRDDLRAMVGRKLRVHTIHNPVLPDDVDSVAAAEPDHPWLQDAGLQVVMSLSRLSEEKDLPTLVRAFARLRASHPCARLLLVGEGAEREPLQRQLEEAGLSDAAALPGRTDQPLAWLRKAAVFVLPSRFEGYGNVLVEALAVGTPVVATDCPVGPREILDGGRFGDLVPVGDDAAMARAISRALTVRRLPDGASRAARQHTQSRTADEYLALLNHLDLTRG
jgi:glycosyltransferase involved in cell wall biosynthesis